MTSNCDVTNSAPQIQMATYDPEPKHPPWKFSAYATAWYIGYVNPPLLDASANHLISIWAYFSNTQTLVCQM